MTNLEWIKSLDNYGMAKFLNDFKSRGACNYCIYGPSYLDECLSHDVDCVTGIRRWFKVDAKDERSY